MQTTRFARLILALVGLCPTAAWAQHDLSFEPYTVYVIEEGGHAHCGPSDDYYRTDPLRRGQSLEVYAETDDGWLGIRPPEDSFCWVQAETIELNDDQTNGTVVEDRTVAWIGTHLGRARSYRWQVQLAEGEAVTVIGRSERAGPDGPQLWYRIVPPSGEYRWVRREQVVDSSEALVAATEQSSRRAAAERHASPPVPQPTVTREATLGDRYVDPLATHQAMSPRPRAEPTETGHADAGLSNDRQSAREDSSAVGSGLKHPVAPEAMASERPSAEQTAGSAALEFISRPRLLEIGGQPAAPRQPVVAGDGNWISGTRATLASAAPVTAGGTLSNPIAQQTVGPQGIAQVSGQAPLPSSTPAATALPSRLISAERIAQIEAETRQADVARLDLIFSRLMAAQATAAEVEPVTRAAYHWIGMASDPTTAGRARMLAERTEQYRRLADRRDGRAVVELSAAPTIPAPMADRPAMPNSAPANLGNPDLGTATSETALTGNLVQVYSARSGSPPYALTDNAGRTIAYVTPTPGTNLRVHLNSQVRVAGSPGFVTGLNTPHIVATTVTRANVE
jgi:hypothetical protein